MKKIKLLSLILSLVLLLQCAAVPVQATEIPNTDPVITESQEPSVPAQLPFGSVCIQEGCRTIEAMRPLAGSARKAPTAQAVMIYDAKTGTMLYSYNPDTKIPPGTLSKIMVALLVVEHCELKEIVTCCEGIQSKIPYGSQNVKLKSGEQLTVEDLLHCLLLQSANDACVALAMHVSGTTGAFLELMNRRAREIGCVGTEFGNISGLDNAVSFTTARDMTKIMTMVSENATLMKILGTSAYEVPPTNKTEEKRSFETLTYLLQNKNVTKYYFKQVTGGYPSFIPTLGASVVCTAEGNGMNLICVLLGATRTYFENGWQVDSYGNFDEMLDLLKFSFEKYKVAQVLYENQSLYQFDVANGECDVVGTPHVNISSVLPNESYMKYLQLKVDTGGSLSAPVKKDDKIATAALYYRDVCLLEAELFAMNDVQMSSDAPVVTNDVVAEKKESGGFMSVVGTICVVILGGFGVYLAVNNFRRAQAKKTARRRRANRRRSY